MYNLFLLNSKQNEQHLLIFIQFLINEDKKLIILNLKGIFINSFGIKGL
jgi:hypothetical protein